MDPALIRREFPSGQGPRYFNSAGATLCPVSVRDRVRNFLDELSDNNLQAYARHLPLRAKLRQRLADELGAGPDEIAVTHHTAEGAGIVANGLDWQPGDTVMTLSREYPSTVYPWMNLERQGRARLILLEEEAGRLDEVAILEALERERPRLFAISAVEWNSGWRFDLEPIGRRCEELGTFFFVDTAQAAGFCPVEARRWRASALAGSAWKWLFGPAGQGYFYLRRELLDTIDPCMVGSESVPDSHDYSRFHFELKPDAGRFEYSTQNLSALVWFEAGLRFLDSLDREALRRHVFDLQDHALERLAALGCATRGGGPDERRSGIIAFRHPRLPSEEIARSLRREQDFFCQVRDGCLRLAFHCYNDRTGLDRLLDHVAGL